MHRNARGHVKKILEQEGITLDPDSFDFQKMCRAYLLSEVEMFKVERKRNVADYSDDVNKLFPIKGNKPKQDSTPPVESTEHDSITLKGLIDKFINEKIRAGIDKAALKQYNASFNLMIKIFGNNCSIRPSI